MVTSGSIRGMCRIRGEDKYFALISDLSPIFFKKRMNNKPENVNVKCRQWAGTTREWSVGVWHFRNMNKSQKEQYRIPRRLICMDENRPGQR
jgi:hypothetical protein